MKIKEHKITIALKKLKRYQSKEPWKLLTDDTKKINFNSLDLEVKVIILSNENH